MRILMLTWEFPPYIAGGLGMACYGLVRALLEIGVEVDLLLPTAEEVYFPMRKAEDADEMPVCPLDPNQKEKYITLSTKTTKERLEAVGMSLTPESYISTAPQIKFEAFLDDIWHTRTYTQKNELDKLRIFLRGNEPIFKKVQEMAQRISKYASTFNFDLIHAHDWLTYPAGMVLRELTGKPLISHIHATEFDRAGGPGDDRIHNIEYAGLSSANTVIAVSKYTSQMIIDRYRIPPEKIRVVHNAYTVSENIHLNKKKIFKHPLVLFLGRITLQKGPDYFIEVAEKVLKTFKDVRFVMGGTGDMFSKILKASATKKLKDRFLFAGFLNREQVEEILLATDIFVLPSVSEPFGIVPLEAMAFGAAAIVSKQSGVSEVIENVYKVDFWDIDKTAGIITELLSDPKKLEDIAERGRSEVIAIGWHKAAEELKLIYGEF